MQDTEYMYIDIQRVQNTEYMYIDIQRVQNTFIIKSNTILFSSESVFFKLNPFLKHVYIQVMVTEGPGGEDSMVYDITLSEIQGAMEH